MNAPFSPLRNRTVQQVTVDINTTKRNLDQAKLLLRGSRANYWGFLANTIVCHLAGRKELRGSNWQHFLSWRRTAASCGALVWNLRKNSAMLHLVRWQKTGAQAQALRTLHR